MQTKTEIDTTDQGSLLDDLKHARIYIPHCKSVHSERNPQRFNHRIFLVTPDALFWAIDGLVSLEHLCYLSLSAYFLEKTISTQRDTSGISFHTGSRLVNKSLLYLPVQPFCTTEVSEILQRDFPLLLSLSILSWKKKVKAISHDIIHAFFQRRDPAST